MQLRKPAVECAEGYTVQLVTVLSHGKGGPELVS